MKSLSMSGWFMLVTFMSMMPVEAGPPSDRKVALFGTASGRYDVEWIIEQYLMPTDDAYKVLYEDAGEWLAPEQFEAFAAVVVARQRGGESRPWTDEEIETVLRYVQNGGHLILLANAPHALAGSGRDLSRLEPILGARRWTSVPDEGRVLHVNHPLTRHLESPRPDWAGGANGLAQFTSAHAVVGSPDAGVVATHHIGRGRVSFFAHEAFRLVKADWKTDDAYGRMIEAAILAAQPTRRETDHELWDPTPLGPEVDRAWDERAPTRRQIEPTLQQFVASGEAIVLVEEETPRALLVLGEDPSRAARIAAADLQSGIRKMSNAELPIVRVNELRDVQIMEGRVQASYEGEQLPFLVLVGDSTLARDVGFDADALTYDGYVLRTSGNVLLVAGRDERENGATLAGTRHAVVSFLERHLGFRWLWPGELGEVVPSASTIRVNPVHERDVPRLGRRRIRNHGSGRVVQRNGRHEHRHRRYQAGLDLLDLTPEGFFDWHSDAGPWFHRQRLGSPLNMHYGHAYNNYWNQFGEERREWFALQPTGDRVQSAYRPRLCVSNMELADHVADTKIQELYDKPDMDVVSISPNDGSASNTFCMCQACRRLDPPNNHDVEIMYEVGSVRRHVTYPALSDRYLTFYNRIAEQVAEVHPERMVAGYAYSAYRAAPLNTQAHSNLVIGFVGLSYFNDAARQRDRETWEAWAQVAEKLFLRPNIFHQGHGLPAVFVNKLAEDVRRCYETGMIAADFDSALHHWATHGLNYYVLAKLLWDPSQDVEQIVQDYCDSGFGPAATQVREYFDQLEQLTNRIAAEQAKVSTSAMREEERDWISIRGGFESQYFTPAVIDSLSSILDEARQAAQEHETILRRIDFLAQGLRYAELQAQLFDPELENDTERGRELLQERHRFYRELFENQPFTINIAWLAFREGDQLYRRFDWAPNHD